MRIKIGDLLVKAGVITELQLKAALAEQSQWGGKLGDILVRMEFVTEEVLVRALSKQTGISRADLSGEGDQEALAKVPPDMAEEFGVVPLALQDEGRTLVIAMSDPGNVMVIDHLRSMTNARIVAQLAGPSAIRGAISAWYRGEALLDERTDPNARLQIVSNSGSSMVVPQPRVGVGQQPQASRPRTGEHPQQRPVDPQQAAAAPVNGAAKVAAQAAVARDPRKLPPPPVGPESAQPTASELLRSVEETQRRSVAALKAMVELLIEKGVFSRDEYLARVKR